MTLPSEDPVVRASRRECALALGMWAVAMTYTLSYCYANGYGRAPDTLTFVLWFPDWVFWGIVVPWLICAALSIPFAYRLMGHESLGADTSDGSTLPGQDVEVDHG